MFEEIVFDPRIDKHLFNAYKTAIEAKAFPNRVVQSVLYKPPEELIVKI